MQTVTVWLCYFISFLKLRLGSSLTEVKQRAKDENKSHNKYTTILLFCIEFILYSTVGRVWVPPPPPTEFIKFTEVHVQANIFAVFIRP